MSVESTIVIDRPAPAQRIRAPKMLLVTEQGQRLVIPFAPLEVEHGEIGRTFVQLDRPGREPLLERAGRKLRTMSMTFIVAVDGQTSVEGTLAAFRRLADAGDRLTVAYGPSEAGWWRITTCSMRSISRSEASHDISHGEVTVEFTQADISAPKNVGPLTGGAVGVGTRSGTSKGGATTRIRKGESLTALSNRVHGTPSRWREIAKANKITDPRKIPPGTTLSTVSATNEIPLYIRAPTTPPATTNTPFYVSINQRIPFYVAAPTPVVASTNIPFYVAAPTPVAASTNIPFYLRAPVPLYIRAPKTAAALALRAKT